MTESLLGFLSITLKNLIFDSQKLAVLGSYNSKICTLEISKFTLEMHWNINQKDTQKHCEFDITNECCFRKIRKSACFC